MQSVLLLLSFLLLSHGGAAGASDAVVDVNGDEVIAGQLYKVFPALIHLGGLKLASPVERCPLYVVADPVSGYEPEPLAFFPENSTEDTVREGDTLFIKFFRPTPCPQSSVWKYDVETRFVGTGGTTTHARDINYSRFAILKSKVPNELYDTTYSFKPCPYGVGVECFPILGLLPSNDIKSHYFLSEGDNIVAYWVFVKVQEGAMGSKIRPVASRAKA